MKKQQTDPADLRRLEELLKRDITVRPDGVSVDLSRDPERWNRLILAVGRKAAYQHLAQALCAAFRRQNGRDLIFTEDCVAYELGWHINAYLWTRGFPGYPRHILTRFFSRAALDRHCRSVEIDEKDLRDWKQRLVFHYKKGLRK